MLQLEYQFYQVRKKYIFRIAKGSRIATPLLFTKISFKGVSGYGEASMPPLYGESPQSAKTFLSKVDLSRFNDPYDVEGILEYVNKADEGNTAVKASIDIALHDLLGKINDQPLYKVLNLTGIESAITAKTIGIDKADVIKKRVNEADAFQMLKVKLGGGNDKEIIDAIRSESAKPIYVDANQGWTDKYEALDKVEWLKGMGAVFIEQPMPVDMKNELHWLKSRSSLPIVGDEGIQRLKDVENAEEFYDGINIKLVKCTGINEAMKMIELARLKQLKLMIGCMSESSCSISAGFQLASAFDWVDLDGNHGLLNDPFRGIETKSGKLINNELPGIGLIDPEKSWNQIKESTDLLE